MPIIDIQGMERHYEMASEVVKALDGVSITVEKGERIVLLGPSGSGKTTLLNCVAALDSPTKGTYDFDGKIVPRLKSEEMTTFRRENIGYVFQFATRFDGVGEPSSNPRIIWRERQKKGFRIAQTSWSRR